jgi:ribosomal protein S18 acetylase RimI-like enzyme
MDVIDSGNKPAACAYKPIDAAEYGVLEDFLYEAIFIPDGTDPLPRDVIYAPTLHHYIKDFGKQGDVCYVCECGGRIVGAAWSRILDDTDNKGYGNVGAGIPELAISVLPESRGRGIGTELLKRLHTALRELGYKRISLSVQKENPALRLYVRCGYTIIKEQETDYIMVKRLDGKETIAFGLTLEEL